MVVSTQIRAFEISGSTGSAFSVAFFNGLVSSLGMFGTSVGGSWDLPEAAASGWARFAIMGGSTASMGFPGSPSVGLGAETDATASCSKSAWGSSDPWSPWLRKYPPTKPASKNRM